MARRFLDDILADVSANMPDNDQGLVSVADIRLPMRDMIDSMVTDEATLDVASPKADLPLGTAWETYADWDTSEGDDSAGEGFLKINQGAGVVEGTSIAGFSYLVTASMSVIFPSNRTIDVAVGLGGLPQGFIASITGDGSGDPVTASTTFFFRSAPSGADFSMIWKTNNATDVDVQDARLTVVIWPTRNP